MKPFQQMRTHVELGAAGRRLATRAESMADSGEGRPAVHTAVQVLAPVRAGGVPDRREGRSYPWSPVAELAFQEQACQVWNVPDRTAAQRVAPVSSVPTLFLNGTFDMKTGASWAQRTARTLPRSTTVQIPGIGHWVVPQSPCARKVLASFLTRPTAPDTGCVAGLRWEPFTVIPK
ncbi:alpha/beta hydrolase [Streptomyces sp. NPDC090036]|uniref:alpha/beta hydrolase n=1 Tax=Streptomyces sp. NPDC090036 TaxID=3365926 RepID=UPI00381F8E4C